MIAEGYLIQRGAGLAMVWYSSRLFRAVSAVVLVSDRRALKRVVDDFIAASVWGDDRSAALKRFNR